MNKKSKAAEATPKSKPLKSEKTTESSGAKSTKAETAKTKAAKTPDFDFIGKVESIRVQNAPGQPLFTFGLKGRSGVRRSFQITTTDSFALNIMAPIVTAAHVAETKIGVRVGAGDEVVEVQSRPRLGKNS
jgi:hypothetical protein